MITKRDTMFASPKQARRECHDTLTISNEDVAQWFQGLKMIQQDNWVADVVENDTAYVEGYYNRPFKLDIEYVYLQ